MHCSYGCQGCNVINFEVQVRLDFTFYVHWFFGPVCRSMWSVAVWELFKFSQLDQQLK